jgi:hypothetical protein
MSLSQIDRLRFPNRFKASDSAARNYDTIAGHLIAGTPSEHPARSGNSSELTGPGRGIGLAGTPSSSPGAQGDDRTSDHPFSATDSRHLLDLTEIPRNGIRQAEGLNRSLGRPARSRPGPQNCREEVLDGRSRRRPR